MDLIFASVLNDNILIQINKYDILHGKVLNYIIHMYPANSYNVALNGVDVVHEMEGQKRNIYVLPTDGF